MKRKTVPVGIPLVLLLFLLLLVLALPGCGDKKAVLSDTYTGGQGASLKLMEDGTFSFYSNALSSYIAHGTYRLTGDTLVLDAETEGMEKERYFFTRNGENFIFQKEESSQRAWMENGTVLQRQSRTEESADS